jgi:hypothetical protein
MSTTRGKTIGAAAAIIRSSIMVAVPSLGMKAAAFTAVVAAATVAAAIIEISWQSLYRFATTLNHSSFFAKF